MSLHKCDDTGSMPVELLTRGPFELNAQILTDTDLTDFQREVLGLLLPIVERYRPSCSTVRVGMGRRRVGVGSTVFVSFVPHRDVSPDLTIQVSPSSSVFIGAGQETTIGLPSDVWDNRVVDVPVFAARIVEAVLCGKLTERIYYCGAITVRSESELDVDGVPVLVQRTDVGAALRTMFRRRDSRDVTYQPYG